MTLITDITYSLVNIFLQNVFIIQNFELKASVRKLYANGIKYLSFIDDIHLFW